MTHELVHQASSSDLHRPGSSSWIFVYLVFDNSVSPGFNNVHLEVNFSFLLSFGIMVENWEEDILSSALIYSQGIT